MTETLTRELRNAFGAFPTGVTVATTREPDGTPCGFTANSFTSVSLDPPMLLICIAKTAHSCGIFEHADHFTINILSEDQKEISGLFASRQPDKFEQAEWHAGHADMPIITASLASFVCARDQIVDAGDHIILIGKVVTFDTNEGAPLGYHAGAYFSIDAQKPLVAAAARSGKAFFGAILRLDQNILLNKSEDGVLSVPRAPSSITSHEGLVTMFADQGLETSPQTLYAVYEDTATGSVGVFYHGTTRSSAPSSGEMVPINAIPFERISNQAERSMLKRYAREYRHGSFGIYQGNQDTGTVHQLTTATP